jgi:hypothetical protein
MMRGANLVALMFGVGALLTATLTLSADTLNITKAPNPYIVVNSTPGSTNALQGVNNVFRPENVREPGTLLLLGAGLFSIAGIARRRLNHN